MDDEEGNATLIDEISVLEARRDVLLDELKSLDNATLSDLVQKPELSKNLSVNNEFLKETPLNQPALHYDRLSGISFFQPNDPEELSRKTLLVKNKKTGAIETAPSIPLLGVRFDIMLNPVNIGFTNLSENPISSASGMDEELEGGNRFDVPYYIIFRVFHDSFALYKYTIPSFLNIQEWADEYLTGKNPERFRIFLWKVDKLLTAYICRKNVLLQINKSLTIDGTNISANLSCTHLVIQIPKVIQATLVCSSESTRVVKSRIYQYSDENWKRDHRLELSLLDNKRWVNILVSHLTAPESHASL
ncbi:Inner kinetochore subunit mal2 [Schizosaccharomyces pombe]